MARAAYARFVAERLVMNAMFENSAVEITEDLRHYHADRPAVQAVVSELMHECMLWQERHAAVIKSACISAECGPADFMEMLTHPNVAYYSKFWNATVVELMSDLPALTPRQVTRVKADA